MRTTPRSLLLNLRVFSDIISNFALQLKKFGADTTKKTGKKCNAIVADMYKQACPILKEQYVKKGILAVKPKLTKQEWK